MFDVIQCKATNQKDQVTVPCDSPQEHNYDARDPVCCPKVFCLVILVHQGYAALMGLRIPFARLHHRIQDGEQVCICQDLESRQSVIME